MKEGSIRVAHALDVRDLDLGLLEAENAEAWRASIGLAPELENDGVLIIRESRVKGLVDREERVLRWNQLQRSKESRRK